MPPTLPTWFKQRQGKAEPAGENVYRLTAPILPESFIGIRPSGDGRWSAFLRMTADGADVAATEARFTTPNDAWEAAFELHRTTLVV
jgi:hypothetical protein